MFITIKIALDLSLYLTPSSKPIMKSIKKKSYTNMVIKKAEAFLFVFQRLF